MIYLLIAVPFLMIIALVGGVACHVADRAYSAGFHAACKTFRDK